MAVQPAVRELRVARHIEQVHEAALRTVAAAGGTVKRSVPGEIEASFGSWFKTRLLGAFFLSRDTWPKRLRIVLTAADGQTTHVTVRAEDAFGFGLRTGIAGRYRESLEALADYTERALMS
jgi:hypothetical protein